MSAALSEGASFTPSPVMATISWRVWNSRTMRSFCSGVVRAKTISSCLQSCAHWVSLRRIISGPLSTMDVARGAGGISLLSFSDGGPESGWGLCRERDETSLTMSGGLVMMPHSVAMACAVSARSPVTYHHVSRVYKMEEGGAPTMKIRIPARRNVETTEGIPSRGGSTIPSRATNVRPDRAWGDISVSWWLDSGAVLNSSFLIVFRASRMTRLPSLAQPFLISSISPRVSSSSSFESPSMVVYLEHRVINISGAPLMVKRLGEENQLFSHTGKWHLTYRRSQNSRLLLLAEHKSSRRVR